MLCSPLPHNTHPHTTQHHPKDAKSPGISRVLFEAWCAAEHLLLHICISAIQQPTAKDALFLLRCITVECAAAVANCRHHLPLWQHCSDITVPTPLLKQRAVQRQMQSSAIGRAKWVMTPLSSTCCALWHFCGIACMV